MHQLRRILALILFALSGCAYQPVFNADLVEVDEEQRSEYWIPEAPSVQIKFPFTQEQVAEGGRAVIEYVIDSNGRVTHLQVVESSGPVWEAAAQRVVAKSRYKPAPGNESRVPIVTRTEVTFGPARANGE